MNFIIKLSLSKDTIMDVKYDDILIIIDRLTSMHISYYGERKETQKI